MSEIEFQRLVMSKMRLFLLDAHALCYRSFYAIKTLATSKGQATNAVYGFANTLKKILKDYQPEYMAVCFDSKGKTHREAKFAEYKIQRPSMPEDLISQIPIIKEVIKAFQVSLIEAPGFEADDIIATLTHKAVQRDWDVVIVSEDKDMYQLAQNSKVKFLSAKNENLIEEKDLQEKLGFQPNRIQDFIGLAGDSVDNIPGVKGVGEVTARDLINEFGSLENILSNMEKIKSAKVREKITAQKEMAVLCKDLASLDANVPINLTLDELKVQSPDTAKLYTMFKDLEFRRLSEEFSPAQAEGGKKTAEAKLIDSAPSAQKLIENVERDKKFTFLLDLSEQNDGFSLEGMVILAGTEVYYLPRKWLKELKEVFKNKDILKVTHNIKEALKILAPENIEFAGKIFDTMLAGYLLSPKPSAVKLGDLAWDFLNESLSEDNKLASGVVIIEKLMKVMLKGLEERSLLNLLDEIEIPLANVLFKMETQGVNLDQPFLAKLSQTCAQRIQELESQIYKIAGEEFNLNSPKQLSSVLFEKLKLPVVKRTKTGFSTDEGVLTVLAKNHDVPALILEYRHLAKLTSTYIDALPTMVNPKTGRIHAQFNQAGTETGRLSSNNPNLQNIPIRTEMGKQIRRAIIPSTKENILLAADYSQIELRVLAHLSKDKTLKKAFEDDVDIHRYTGSLIFDVDESKVTDEMRYATKRVNFGIIYGMSAFGLAKDLDISQEEAQAFIDKYFLRYPGVKIFMDKCIHDCEKNGYVVTLLKRRRYLPEINSKDNAVRQFAQRQAINTPVQGSAADLIKLAMIHIQNEMEKRNLDSRMIMTVHDELVFDVPQKEKSIMAGLVKDLMEHAMALDVPVKVTLKAGENWLDMKEIK